MRVPQMEVGNLMDLSHIHKSSWRFQPTPVWNICPSKLWIISPSFRGPKSLDKNFEGLALQMMFRFHFGVNKNVKRFFFASTFPIWPGTVTQPFLDHQWNKQFKNLTIFLLSKGLPSQKLTWHLQGGRVPKGNSSSNPQCFRCYC